MYFMCHFQGKKVRESSNRSTNKPPNGVGLSSETMEAGSGATFSSTERKESLVLNSISHKNFCQE